MDHRTDVRDFLVSRRARVSPERAGLPSYGGKRRVPGLRREEVALLAGLSVDCYARAAVPVTRPEQGSFALCAAAIAGKRAVGVFHS